MSNGYSAVPNIIAGNATITGTLTVTGDGGIRIGSAAPFVRLFKDGAARLALSMNLGTDLSTRDVTTQLAHDLAMGEPGYSPRLFEYNPLGTLLSSMLDRTLGINGTLAVNTGNVTENTVGDVLIPGNTLGPHGSLKIEWSLVATMWELDAADFVNRAHCTPPRRTRNVVATPPWTFATRDHSIFSEPCGPSVLPGISTSPTVFSVTLPVFTASVPLIPSVRSSMLESKVPSGLYSNRRGLYPGSPMARSCASSVVRSPVPSSVPT